MPPRSPKAQGSLFSTEPAPSGPSAPSAPKAKQKAKPQTAFTGSLFKEEQAFVEHHGKPIELPKVNFEPTVPGYLRTSLDADGYLVCDYVDATPRSDCGAAYVSEIPRHKREKHKDEHPGEYIARIKALYEAVLCTSEAQSYRRAYHESKANEMVRVGEAVRGAEGDYYLRASSRPDLIERLREASRLLDAKLDELGAKPGDFYAVVFRLR